MKKAQIPDAQCIECREGITNPICPDCLAKEIEAWKPWLKPILSAPGTYVAEGVRCMFCGRLMSICAHCYTKDLYNYLVEQEPEIAEEFLEIFDFGIKEELI